MINKIRNISSALFAVGLLTLSGGLVTGLSPNCPNPSSCFSAAVLLITSDHNTNSTPRYSEQSEDANVGTLSHDEMTLSSAAQVDQSANSDTRDGLLLVSIYLVVFSLFVIIVLESIEIHYLKHIFSLRRTHRRRA
jgi:hypothetical protein